MHYLLNTGIVLVIALGVQHLFEEYSLSTILLWALALVLILIFGFIGFIILLCNSLNKTFGRFRQKKDNSKSQDSVKEREQPRNVRSTNGFHKVGEFLSSMQTNRQKSITRKQEQSKTGDVQSDSELRPIQSMRANYQGLKSIVNGLGHLCNFLSKLPVPSSGQQQNTWRQNHHGNQMSKRKATEPVKCIVCLEMTRESVGCSNCSHFCCAPCFEKHIKYAVNDGQTQIKCPGCSSPTTNDVVSRHMSPYQRQQVEQNKKEQTAFRCKSCQGECKDSTYSKRCTSCVRCKNSWCMDCGERYHYLATTACQTWSFREWKSRHEVKRCPHCRRYIEKNEGCDHMTCTKCKHEFCWRCLQKWYQAHKCVK